MNGIDWERVKGLCEGTAPVTAGKRRPGRPAGSKNKAQRAKKGEARGSDLRVGERLTYSIDEVAKMLGVGRTTLHEATNSGQVPCIRVGNRKLISRAIVTALLTDGLPRGRH